MVYDQNFRGGVNLTVANIDGRVEHNKSEIIVAPMEGLSPQVKIFDNYGVVKKQFMAYDNKFKNGVSLTAGDVNNDGSAEIVTGAGPGGAPHVRVFSPAGEILESFYAYADTFNKGVSVGFILMDN
jgi:serralysin